MIRCSNQINQSNSQYKNRKVGHLYAQCQKSKLHRFLRHITMSKTQRINKFKMLKFLLYTEILRGLQLIK